MLFNDLVGSGSLTDSEFWVKYTQTHSMPDRSSVGSSQASRNGSSGSGARDQPPTQHVGMQNAMLQVKVRETCQLCACQGCDFDTHVCVCVCTGQAACKSVCETQEKVPESPLASCCG